MSPLTYADSKAGGPSHRHACSVSLPADGQRPVQPFMGNFLPLKTKELYCGVRGKTQQDTAFTFTLLPSPLQFLKRRTLLRTAGPQVHAVENLYLHQKVTAVGQFWQIYDHG